MFITKLAVLVLPLSVMAAPLRARQGDDASKLNDSVGSAKTNIGVLLRLFDVENDLGLFRAGNVAIDGVVEAEPAAGRIAEAVKSGKTPSASDQFLVKASLDKAENNLKIVQTKNDAKPTKGAADKEAKLKKALSDSQASVSAAKDAAFKLSAGKKDTDLVNDARVKVIDDLNSAKNSISSVLNILDGSEDALLFRPGNQAIDEVVDGITAATKMADAVKAGQTPADADQVSVTLALDFATRFIIATKRANDRKLSTKSTFDNDKENKIIKSLEDAKAAVEDAVLLDTSILTSQGKTVDEVIDAARDAKLKGLRG